ncbi:hypothetical protein FBR02_19050 [Anaerolineae bacterium CFX9]|nr:hypothetical protein [Anaerolineae bacterium CFX9]
MHALDETVTLEVLKRLGIAALLVKISDESIAARCTEVTQHPHQLFVIGKRQPAVTLFQTLGNRLRQKGAPARHLREVRVKPARQRSQVF